MLLQHCGVAFSSWGIGQGGQGSAHRGVVGTSRLLCRLELEILCEGETERINHVGVAFCYGEGLVFRQNQSIIARVSHNLLVGTVNKPPLDSTQTVLGNGAHKTSSQTQTSSSLLKSNRDVRDLFSSFAHHFHTRNASIRHCERYHVQHETPISCLAIDPTSYRASPSSLRLFDSSRGPAIRQEL